MNSNVLLTYYCLLVLLVSIAGGMIPIWIRLTHRWMECAVSFVAGVMLGIGLLHMLPHALEQATSSGLPPAAANMQVMLWLLAGLLAMFFIERFFCFHHHEVEDGEVTCHHGPESGHDHSHGHNLSWSGAALGLTLHSVIEGIALAAGVAHGHESVRLAGFGTFLVIVLHKPFDSMTIATLMAHGGWSLTWRHVVNGLFALAIPLGILIFRFGMMSEGGGGETLSHALAFAAGTFLCIALSDLLPELQFHDHDRGKLSAALLLGLALAWGISQLESTTHSHPPALPTETIQNVPTEILQP
ncbi:ZIP family metal transporter [Bythopirellula goksoeyrii]|uniref:Zinc transporter ZupT n=1 Tax=Bythopirellula goksoeyrii TaxID=1400387 RepID=A0A5B9Q600_9BACT|nr:ZIP family metal transporter [Bythopirellula goksoeyrii]QEG33119.1 zinc transporter ZupT [Bythopirellula goksoeyrii]